MAEPRPEFVSQEVWGPSICISNQFPGDVQLLSSEPQPEELLPSLNHKSGSLLLSTQQVFLHLRSNLQCTQVPCENGLTG